MVDYFSAPRFMVSTLITTRGDVNSVYRADYRLAYYSKELYESAVPKGGCTGTIFGTWQTERGRVTIVQVGDDAIQHAVKVLVRRQGTYTKNNGSFSLKQKGGGYVGEWKDDTGSGTMALLLKDSDSFSASLSRGAAASGGLSRITGLPPGDPLKGKCVP